MKNILKHLEEVIGCFFVVVFVTLTFINVILRYFFNFVMSWAEEVIVLAFSWSVFLGAITAFRQNRHVAIDVIVTTFPVKVQRVVYIIIDVLVLALNIYLAYLSVVLCMNVGVKMTYVLKISFIYVDAALVVSFGLMAVFGVVRLIRNLSEGYQITNSITRTIEEVDAKAVEKLPE
ncbi:putative TRAP transporter small permease protein [Spirochaetia bacterium]|nr:putative TRAP transporter small permease protein [Spirochaetia bacterium]